MGYIVGTGCSTSSTIPAMTAHYGTLLLLLLLLFVFNIYILVVVITILSSVRRVITNDQRLAEYSCLYISNTFSVFLHFPTSQSFALLQHCMLCLASPSTYPILQKHFQGLLSLQEQFLHFSISTIF